MRRLPKFYRSKGAEGQSVLESLLCMIVLCLIFFGLLQIFNIAVAKVLSYYSSYRTARSYSVGFSDYLISRSTRVAAIGASGKMVEPDNREYDGLRGQFDAETLLIPEYLSGTNWLEYEFWAGENEYDPQYYHSDVAAPDTFIYEENTASLDGLVRSRVGFRDYPFVFFDLMDKDRIWFGAAGTTTDIDGETGLVNHSEDYLQ